MRETYMSVAGVVASEPRVVQLDDDRRITSFRLASTSRRRDRKSNAWVDGDTIWATVTCWRDLAANAADSLHKRDRVIVYGRVRTRDWTGKDGGVRTTLEMDAEAVGHDLAYGTSSFDRKIRSQVLQRPHEAEANNLAERVTEESMAALVTTVMHVDESEDELIGELRMQQAVEDEALLAEAFTALPDDEEEYLPAPAMAGTSS